MDRGQQTEGVKTRHNSKLLIGSIPVEIVLVKYANLNFMAKVILRDYR